MSGNASEQESTCVVCFKNVEIYSIGVCEHPVCYECSTRMRVLCKQNECPICRGDLPKVILTKVIEPFATLKSRLERTNYQDVKYGVLFCSPSIQRAYYCLLEFNCAICPPSERRWPFKTFVHLKEHMRRDHELFYCDLCVENLKIFAFERKCYTRAELAQHRRKGDPDNTSHKGHPLCEFCDQRYMDSDELFRHLRRDHLYCHFCDADGKHQYYSTYDDLRNHFLEEHYLCEEGDCKNEQFTSVFRTDIDYKAHVASVHSKHLSRAANKQARTLEVEFNFGPRAQTAAQQRAGRRQMNLINQNERSARPTNSNNGHNFNQRPEENETYSTEPGGNYFVNPLRDTDFPSLGNDSGGAALGLGPSKTSVTLSSKIRPNFTREEFPTLGKGAPVVQPNAVAQKARGEDFPTLGPSRNITITKTTTDRATTSRKKDFPALESKKSGGGGGGSTVRVTLNQERPQSSRPNVSIHVNHTSNGSMRTTFTAAPSTVQVRPKSSVEDFPVLGNASTSTGTTWVQAKSKRQHEPKAAKAAPAPVLPPSSLAEFPSLSKKGATPSISSPLNWTRDEVKKGTKKGKKSKGDEKVEVKETKVTNVKPIGKDVKEAKNVKDAKGKTKVNQLVKKTSTLKIGTLEMGEGAAAAPPPPGISIKPPPGFNFIKNSNDLTFTNSAGQSYSILPTHSYSQPANFVSRNSRLIQSFFTVLKTDEAINEFKGYSELFRKGGYPAENYYEHCRTVLADAFEKLFPELLVLLPDIERQQELYRVHRMKTKVKELEECATCKQVIYTREMKQHYGNHYMENHFPSLGDTIETNNVWKK